MPWEIFADSLTVSCVANFSLGAPQSDWVWSIVWCHHPNCHVIPGESCDWSWKEKEAADRKKRFVLTFCSQIETGERLSWCTVALIFYLKWKCSEESNKEHISLEILSYEERWKHREHFLKEEKSPEKLMIIKYYVAITRRDTPLG